VILPATFALLFVAHVPPGVNPGEDGRTTMAHVPPGVNPGEDGRASSTHVTAAERFEEWPSARFVATPAACFRHPDLVARLKALEARYPGRVKVEEAGRSALGRPIHLVTVGQGPRRVLLWSQMHGDEPSATPALLDLADRLLAEQGTGRDGHVLDRLTLLLVPMLNPDGTERYARRNAQGIDINRDALNLATPEGRLLKEVRDRHQPVLGFNLHDQDRRTVVGEGGALASISLLAVSGDPQGTVTEGRLRAKRVASLLAATLAPFVGAASIGRYDEDWSPRAFGDNITAWGTPVVLIESGGLAPGRPLTDLTRLNYVGLHAALAALALDDVAGHDPAVYEALARNQSDAFADVVVRGGHILQAPTFLPYRADLAFNVEEDDLAGFGCPVPVDRDPKHSEVFEVGDARFLAAGQAVPASGLTLIPAFVVDAEGLGSRRWLDRQTLEELARLGVGRVNWHVKGRDMETAILHVWKVEGPGLPELAVQSGERKGEPSPLRPVGRPRVPRGRRVLDFVNALGPRVTGTDRGLYVPLTTGGRASFLLVDRGVDGDIREGEVKAVFIDGRAVELR
jgi:hypothetical protein